MIKKAVKIYNNKRSHFSLKIKTPKFIHTNRNIDYHF